MLLPPKPLETGRLPALAIVAVRFCSCVSTITFFPAGVAGFPAGLSAALFYGLSLRFLRIERFRTGRESLSYMRVLRPPSGTMMATWQIRFARPLCRRPGGTSFEKKRFCVVKGTMYPKKD